jgi:hypothetical protein
MKSAREPKLKTYISSKLSAHDSRGMRSHSRTDRSGGGAWGGLRKRMTQSLQQLSKRVLINNLSRHNSTPDKYAAKVTNDIIYDEKKHLVCIFKDFLLWDEYSDFLKRYYSLSESVQRIPGYWIYYSKYSVMRPVYFRFACSKIMYKNFKKHRKFFEQIEEIEERNQYQDENMEPSEFSKLIKSNLMDDRHNNNIKNYEEFSVATTNQDRERHEVNRDPNDDLRYDYSNSDIFLDHFNNSNNFSLYSQFNRLMHHDNNEDNFNNVHLNMKKGNNLANNLGNIHFNTNLKTNINTHMNIKKDLMPNSAKKTIRNNPYTSSNNNYTKEKIVLMVPNSLQSNKQESTRTFKKIEIGKLDLKNINKLSEAASNHLNTNNKLEYETCGGKFSAATTRNKPYLNPITNSKVESTKTTGNSPRIKPSPQMKSKLTDRQPETAVSIDNFNLKTVINTNDIKKRLNLVENVVKKLKENQVKEKKSINSLKDSKNKGRSSGGSSANIINMNKDKTLSKEKQTKTMNTHGSQNLLKNNVIKSNTDLAKNIINNENTNSIVNKYFSNNLVNSYSHLKTNSNNTPVNNATPLASQYNSQQSSVYNINLNLNLNVNLNMLERQKSKASNNTSKGGHAEEKLNGNYVTAPTHALTERPSMNYNNTLTSSKIDKLLEKTEKISMANIKSNEKYKKLSRNMNVKNFILNYGSQSNNTAQFDKNNFSNRKSKNLVININNTNSNNVPEREPLNNHSNNTSKLSVTPKNNKNNNFNLYYKKFISNVNTGVGGVSNIQPNYLTDSHSHKRNHLSKVIIDNLKFNPNSNTLSCSGSNNLTSNTFNQRNLIKKDTKTNASSREKKPLSINLKKNQFEKIREIVNKYPLTSRNEKESIKIFNNI